MSKVKSQISNVKMSVDHVRSYEISVDLVRSQYILWDPSIIIRVCRNSPAHQLYTDVQYFFMVSVKTKNPIL